MSFYRQVLQDKDYAIGVPILPRQDDESQYWVDGVYPPGFDPPPFLRIGPIVSANNQRPEGYPSCAQGAVALVVDGLPRPIDSDTRFIAALSSKLAETQHWKTNSLLQSEFDVYSDGVRKNVMRDVAAPSMRQEMEAQVRALRQRAYEYRNASQFNVNHRPGPVPAEELARYKIEREKDSQQLEKEADQLERQYQLVGASIDAKTAAGPQLGAPEGQAARNYQYGNAQTGNVPVALAGPSAIDKQGQTSFNQAPGAQYYAGLIRSDAKGNYLTNGGYIVGGRPEDKAYTSYGASGAANPDPAGRYAYDQAGGVNAPIPFNKYGVGVAPPLIGPAPPYRNPRGYLDDPFYDEGPGYLGLPGYDDGNYAAIR